MWQQRLNLQGFRKGPAPMPAQRPGSYGHGDMDCSGKKNTRRKNQRTSSAPPSCHMWSKHRGSLKKRNAALRHENVTRLYTCAARLQHPKQAAPRPRVPAGPRCVTGVRERLVPADRCFVRICFVFSAPFCPQCRWFAVQVLDDMVKAVDDDEASDDLQCPDAQTLGRATRDLLVSRGRKLGLR
eukprot:scaffold7404_cov286-Pinguiococcus_pyrenoidosus.AAC.3